MWKSTAFIHPRLNELIKRSDCCIYVDFDSSESNQSVAIEHRKKRKEDLLITVTIFWFLSVDIFSKLRDKSQCCISGDFKEVLLHY